MAKDEDGLTFSGPVDSERGRVHTPEAFQIPSWRSVHPSKEELSRISNPSFAGLAVLVVLVMFVGIGLAFIMDGRFLAGMILIVAGIVVSLPVVQVNGSRSLEVMRGWGFRASIEDGMLVIEQDSVDEHGETRTDNVSLAAHEARQLVDWIADQVEVKP